MVRSLMALLRGFSERVREQIRESDTLARLGGDEFTVIVENLREPEDAANIAAKIVRCMQQPFRLEGLDVQVGTSVGVGLYTGEELAADELVKQADTALCQAKAAGRNTFVMQPPRGL